MPSQTYEPDIYDLVTPASIQGDAEWYRRRASAIGGPVLELGAGTGRITLGIAREGVAIHALDAHPAMLGALRRKLEAQPQEVSERVTVIQGDMRAFTLSDRFPLIIAPFRVFLHNLTEGDQLACLRSVRAHLAPSGALCSTSFTRR